MPATRRIPPLALDAGVAAAVAAAGVVESAFKREVVMANRAAAIPLVVLSCLGLLWRRRSPVTAVAITGVALCLPPLVGDDPTFWGGFVPFLISQYSVGVHAELRWPVALAGIVGAAGLLGVVRPDYRAPSQLVFNIMLPLAAWAGGRSITAWRERAEAISRAADMRLRQQELEAREGLVAERNRIARDLHDIVAHQISIMVVQAGAAQRVVDTDVAAASQAMVRVQEAGRRAIADMYLMLGILRGEEHTADETGQPTVARLAELVEQVTGAGLPTCLRVDGTPRPLPEALDVSAFRIVQEALTNAVKHAGPAEAEVVLRWSEDRLQLEVRNTGHGARVPPATTSSGGHGLVGLRERAALHGGDFRAEPSPDGGFIVTASLPLRSST